MSVSIIYFDVNLSLMIILTFQTVYLVIYEWTLKISIHKIYTTLLKISTHIDTCDYKLSGAFFDLVFYYQEIEKNEIW